MTRKATFYEAWSGTTAYLAGDIVTDSGAAYLCISAHTNQQPPNGTYWLQLNATGGAPSGAAGGVLSGTYPNPGFAVDMATQAELDAHTGDTSDAHDASAISFSPAGSIAATDVQAAIEEVAAEAGGGSGHTIQDEGSNLSARAALNFVGAGVTATDDSGNNATVVTIPGGGGSSLLAVFKQSAGTNQATTSATQADVDATNAAITFTAPASGNVLVRVTASVRISAANQNAFLGLRESTTDIAGPTAVIQGQTATALEHVVAATFYLTGLSAGSHTYKLAYSVNGGATFTIRQIGSGATNYPVTMEVWAAP